MTSLTIPELRQKLSSGAVKSREVVDQLASRVEAVDPKLKAYNYVDADKARAEADKADVSKPLGGVPIAIKDVINVQGDPCTCSSKILQGYVAPYDATVITKLRQAGAVLFGRTNMDEFAMGSSTENSSWGVTRNPWDLERIPGGSSGGSAAAVGGHEAFAALGTDTGGSIRQPAALCSCVGLKPTYGRVSRYGLVAFASSLDQIGTFTKTVEEAALLLEIISGYDPMDNTSISREVPKYTQGLHGGVKGLRLGVPKEYFIEGIDPEVEKAVRAAIDEYKRQGAEIVEVSLPHTKYAVAVYYIIATGGKSEGHSRHVRPDPSGGFRCGGEAPHHSRHLRAEFRLLRRLLQSRAEGAAHDRGGFPTRVSAMRRAPDADFTHRRLQDRRADAGPAANVSRRYFHDRGQPRGHLRCFDSVRIHLGQIAHRPADHRPEMG
jgi:aspartyl-tRNA(Asn)/glutamyl-tRNA(Gln) amidotransferase subunit A